MSERFSPDIYTGPSYMEAWKEAREIREETHPDDPDGGTFCWGGAPYVTFSTKSPTAHLDEYVLKTVKQYWLREEIPIADELMSYASALTEEFLAYHDTFTNSDVPTESTKLWAYGSNSGNVHEFTIQSKKNAWLIDTIKYTYTDKNIADFLYQDPEIKKRFPTACMIAEKYGHHSPCSIYSVIDANSSIKRHTGIENRDGEFIRIHIPLIIPEGDIFFECEGIEIDWTDIWAFDNQLTHSAHNLSPHRRLIFIFDISREYLGLPKGEPYDGIRITRIPKFVRGQLPKMLHKHQSDKLEGNK